VSLPFDPSALHEIYASRDRDGASACGFALGLALELARQAAAASPLLWVRHDMSGVEEGLPSPPGLAEWGLDPARILFVRAKDAVAALQAGLEGARMPGLGAVLIEFRGEARAYDLTASRRLAFAAKTSGALVLVVRTGARPHSSAAATRWRLRALPSRADQLPLAPRTPGPPAFGLTLLRARNGKENLSYHLEWNRNEQRFAILEPQTGVQVGIHSGSGSLEPARCASAPPLSGSVATFPAGGPAAPPLARTG